MIGRARIVRTLHLYRGHRPEPLSEVVCDVEPDLSGDRMLSLIDFMIPAIGGDLMPIAMNVAHFVLFGVSLLLMKRE